MLWWHITATNRFVCTEEINLWKSLSLQQNFVTAKSHTNYVWFEFLQHVAVKKFCCRDKRFHKNSLWHVAATCRLVCTDLKSFNYLFAIGWIFAMVIYCIGFSHEERIHRKNFPYRGSFQKCWFFCDWYLWYGWTIKPWSQHSKQKDQSHDGITWHKQTKFCFVDPRIPAKPPVRIVPREEGQVLLYKCQSPEHEHSKGMPANVSLKIQCTLRAQSKKC